MSHEMEEEHGQKLTRNFGKTKTGGGAWLLDTPHLLEMLKEEEAEICLRIACLHKEVS
jgi:hypothetical protein